MELKFARSFLLVFVLKVLIVPQWNWNCFVGMEVRSCCFSFNRTTVELKWIFVFLLFLKVLRFNRTTVELKSFVLGFFVSFSTVLIVPQWNWNTYKISNSSSLSLVLIVPQWNWNRVEYHYQKLHRRVLIVPQWNWNIFSERIHQNWWLRFNRTTVELKYFLQVGRLTYAGWF